MKTVFLVLLLLVAARVSYGADYKDRLIETAVRIEMAADQGTNQAKFSDLVLDFRTFAELAKPKLNDTTNEAVKTAGSKLVAALRLWNFTLRHECPRDCANDMDPLMRQLGIANPDEFFGVTSYGELSGMYRGQQLVSRALTLSVLSVVFAEAKLTGKN